MKTIAVINFKGGCGKTTASVNVAVGLANHGKKVLLMDVDPQANATSNFVDEKQANMYDVLVNPEVINEKITHTFIPNVDLIVGSEHTSLANANLKESDEGINTLDKAIKNLSDNYDYVIIDCPPGNDEIVYSAMRAAEQGFILVPMKADMYSIDGLNNILETKSFIEEELNIELSVKVLLNMINRNSNDKRVAKELAKIAPAYQTMIHYQAKPIIEAQMNRKFVVNLKYRVSDEYNELVKEIECED